MYYCQLSNEESVMFTGDVIFQGGCGMFFEGSSYDMIDTVEYVKENVPEHTHLFYGHDYAVNNL